MIEAGYLTRTFFPTRYWQENYQYWLHAPQADLIEEQVIVSRGYLVELLESRGYLEQVIESQGYLAQAIESEGYLDGIIISRAFLEQIIESPLDEEG